MNMKKLTILSATFFCATLAFSTHAQNDPEAGALGAVSNFILNGEAAEPAPTGDRAVVIRDLLDNDTGELRFDFPNAPLLTGRAEVTYTRSLSGADAFISILNTSGSTSGGQPIADLRINGNNGAFELRDQQGDADAESDPNAVDVVLNSTLTSPNPDTLQTAVITWNYVNGIDLPPSFTVSIDGTDLNSAVGVPFIAGLNAIGGADRIQFRVGSNGNVSEITDTFTITSYRIYSDVAGTILEASEDFSGFEIGDDLSNAGFDNAVDTTIEETTAQ